MIRTSLIPLLLLSSTILPAGCESRAPMRTLIETITRNLRDVLDLFDRRIDHDDKLRAAVKYLKDKSCKGHVTLIRETPEYSQISKILASHRTIYNLFQRYNDDSFDYLVGSENGPEAPSFSDFLRSTEVNGKLRTIRKAVRRMRLLAEKSKLLEKQPAQRLMHLFDALLKRGVVVTLTGILRSMAFDFKFFANIFTETVTCQVAMS